ncbi:beta strand repeat-containing protein [Stieleria varia]|nr:hypothetical protein [Stieleria varia]
MHHWVDGKFDGEFDGEVNAYQPMQYTPALGILEPRIVLNATAELNVLGQLVLMGDAADDVVRVDVVNDHELQFRDAAGEIIPIAGHSAGINGSPNDPIAVDDIPAGELLINLGGGSDTLTLQIPDQLNVTMVDAAGNDSVELDVQPLAAASSGNTSRLQIAADRITLPASQNTASFIGRDVTLTGGVFLGNNAGFTRIDLGDGSFAVDGRLVLGGDLILSGGDATIDLSEATLLASARQSDLIVDLSTTNSASAVFGEFGVLRGVRVHDLQILSVGNLQFNDSIQIDGVVSWVGNETLPDGVRIDTGTLRLDGTIDFIGATQNDFEIQVGSTAILSGDATIHGDVFSDGIIAPESSGGSMGGEFRVDSLAMSSSAKLSIDVNGSVAGVEHDTIVVDGGVVQITGTELEILDNAVLLPDTEIVLLRNDGSDDVVGRFRSSRDVFGNVLQASRTLDEGDLVIADFAGSGLAAYVTYFGGDGNDVSLVIAGDRTEDIDTITLVTRRGNDIEIRTAPDLVSVFTATPTVRPIEELNGNSLRLIGEGPRNQVLIDVNGFVDPTGQLNVDTEFVFWASDQSDQDRLVIYDSNLSTNDTPASINLQRNALGETEIVMLPGEMGLPSYRFATARTELMDIQLTSQDLTFMFSDASESISIDGQNAIADGSRLLVDALGMDSEILFLNPTVSLGINADAGNDVITVDAFGDEMRASIFVLGGLGTDSTTVAATLSLGSGLSAGNLEIAAEDILVTGDIDTSLGNTSGQITIEGGDQVVIRSRVSANGNSINIDGIRGEIDTSQATLIASQITITNGGTAQIGDLLAAGGEIVLGSVGQSLQSVTQKSGTFIQTDSLSGVVTGDVRLAQSGNQIATVKSFAVDGAFELTDGLGDLSVNNVSGLSDDVRIASAGTVLLGNLAIKVDNGDIEIRAGGSIEDADADDALPNLIGQRIDLIAGAPLSGNNFPAGFGSGVGVLNDVDLVARTLLNVDTSATQGDVRITSVGETIPVGVIDAAGGRVFLVGEAIVDGGESTALDVLSDIIAGQVDLRGESGIGQGQRLELESVNDVVAVTTRGDIDLRTSATDDNVLYREVLTGIGALTIEQFGPAMMTLGSIRNDNGDTVIRNTQGSIEVGASAATDGITVGISGDLSLIAIGNSSDIVLRSGIESAAGDIDVFAGRHIELTSTALLESDSGLVTLIADQFNEGQSGAITMAEGSDIDAGIGRIDVSADGDIAIAEMISRATGDAIRIESINGAIVDAGDAGLDLVASNGTTTLRSRLGIGDSDALEVDLNRLNATVSSVGNIELVESSAIRLESVTTTDGRVSISAVGQIRADDVISMNVGNVDDALGGSSRDVTLITTGSSSDILVGQLDAHASADIHLIAGDDVLQIDTSSLIRADDLTVDASNGVSDSLAAIDLRTQIEQLDALVRGAHHGDLILTELDDLILAGSDADDDSEQVRTGNGEIRISLPGVLSVVDAGRVDDGDDLVNDYEIYAGGDAGRVRIDASEIQFGDFVQLHADQSNLGAVRLTAPRVMLGSDIQIDTGESVGVARIFSPRPDVSQLDDIVPGDEPLGTGFFDFTSIMTNRLEQAAVNDATGILTVKIGNPGERGLTINIDWGAATGRFQQIDLLSGDAPPLTVSHLYLEQDILDSTLNGRPSSTDPLEVLFSVRHHESILVLGDSIQQGDGEAESVDGGVISSTDDPQTFESASVPILESGQARFIIPALSIPVAFFPVRDVIPETEDAEIIIPTTTFVTNSQSGFEVVESSASAGSSRDEFFQLRVLSPDPNADDLVEPTRLPDDILSGDQLKELFAELPDGSYEVQYVLGDGNVRSILQVDLRGGQPTIRGDELDGGEMRLIPLEPETEPSAEASTEAQGENDTRTQRSEKLPAPIGQQDAESAEKPIFYRFDGQNRPSDPVPVDGEARSDQHRTPRAALLAAMASRRRMIKSSVPSHPTH